MIRFETKTKKNQKILEYFWELKFDTFKKKYENKFET